MRRVYTHCPDCHKRSVYVKDAPREGSVLACRTRDCTFSCWLEDTWTLETDAPNLWRWLDINEDAPQRLRDEVERLLDSYAQRYGVRHL